MRGSTNLSSLNRKTFMGKLMAISLYSQSGRLSLLACPYAAQENEEQQNPHHLAYALPLFMPLKTHLRAVSMSPNSLELIAQSPDPCPDDVPTDSYRIVKRSKARSSEVPASTLPTDPQLDTHPFEEQSDSCSVKQCPRARCFGQSPASP